MVSRTSAPKTCTCLALLARSTRQLIIEAVPHAKFALTLPQPFLLVLKWRPGSHGCQQPVGLNDRFFYRRQLMNGLEKHLAGFVAEQSRDWTCLQWLGDYRGSGPAFYHPAVLLSVLVYGYATGVFSNRKLECGTYGDGLAISTRRRLLP